MLAHAYAEEPVDSVSIPLTSTNLMHAGCCQFMRIHEGS
jgi:hypothetical protein